MPTAIIKTPVFTLAFPALDKPYVLPMGVGRDPKYGATMLFDDEHSGLDCCGQLKTIDDMVLKTALDRFTKNDLKDGRVRLPRKPGIKREGLDLSKYTMISAKSANKPHMRDATHEMEGGFMYTADKDTFYPGCLCVAEVTPFSYDVKGYKGVGLALLSITKIADVKVTAGMAELMALDGLVPEDLL